MTETAPPPRSTGRTLPVTLQGGLFAWDRTRAQPLLLEIPGSDLFYIACFSSPEALRAFHERARAPFDSIKQIEDGLEFLAGIAATPGVAVIFDPWFTLEGRRRP